MSLPRRQHGYTRVIFWPLSDGTQLCIAALASHDGRPQYQLLQWPPANETKPDMSYGNNKGIPYALLLFMIVASGNSQADTTTIKNLLSLDDAEAAYQHALTLAPELEGETEFDFLLGMAALKAGHLPEAVFALERVLIAEPNNHRARLELARVYFLQTDYRNAQKEFKTVLAQNPPANVQANIQAYLNTIEKEMKALTQSITSFTSLALGYDTNINASTDLDSINVPALGNVVLNENSKELSDQFAELNVGANGRHMLSRNSSITGKINLTAHNNFSYDAFDTQTANLQIAYKQRNLHNNWQVPLQVQQINVDGESFRRMASLGTDYSRPLNSNIFSFNAQVGRFTYPNFEARDADFINASATWKQRLTNSRAMLSTGINLGYEDPEHTSGDNFERRYSGLQLAWQYTKKNQQMYANLYYQYIEHTKQDSVFLTTRNDKYYQFSLGYTQALDQHWAFNVALLGVVNDSNIALYEYDRALIKGGLSYVF